jgi:hypothetical protein
MNKDIRIIWDNTDVDIDKWDFDSDWIEEYQPTDDQKYERMYDDLNFFIDDERANLDISCNKIIVIANLGLWHGRRQGYKIIDGNVKNILYTDCDYAKWYADEKDIRGKFIHHDGTNYVLYREIKDMDTIDEFTNKIYNDEELTDELLDKYTNSLRPYVAKIYGW